jgi:DNA-binding XRE family transcriptional regulator
MSRHSLKSFRARYGLSRDHLARASGLSVQTIYSLEAGHIRYSRGLALYLAGILHVPLEELS